MTSALLFGRSPGGQFAPAAGLVEAGIIPYGEGLTKKGPKVFALSVGEAMAAKVPCVVTDVGDAAQLVGETGLVVPPKNPAALAAAWMKILRKSSRERRALGLKARTRIIEHFGLNRMVESYYQLYRQVLSG